jgi:hypothetical protein
MTTLPKWTDERTAQLHVLADAEAGIVSKVKVAEFATTLDTTARSIASKLRKLGYDVELASAAPKAFSDEEADALTELLDANPSTFTYAEIATQFADGKFTAKAIQGKILSLELTDLVKPTPKAETVKTYSNEEEATVVAGINAGNFVEDIAASVGKSVASVRGKALTLLRTGAISAMPKQRDVKGKPADALESLGDISGMTVEEIATKLGKTERGVKTSLTRRGITVANYDGAKKKAAASAE